MADKIYRITASVTTVLVLISSLTVTPLAASDFDLDVDAIIEYAYSSAGYSSASAWLDSGELSEWYAFALLRNGGGLDFDRYTNALLSRLAAAEIYSAVERQRYALVLTFDGHSDNAFVTETPDETIGKGGIMSYVFGLHLLSVGIPAENHTADTVIDELLSRRLPDGGWAVSGEMSDVDVTAMTIQALAPYCTDANVKTAVDSALSYLSSVQLDTGGYKSYGVENPESTAQVIIALCSLGIDPMTDARFVKSGSLFSAIEAFKTDDGGYSHTLGGDANATATVQVLLAMIAYDRLQSGSSPLYVPDAVSPDDTDTSTVTTDNVGDTENNMGTTADTHTETSQNENRDDNGAAKNNGSYKPAAVTVVIGIAVGTAIILWLLGKKSGKNFAVLIVLTVIAVAVIIFVDFSLPEDYYGTSETKNDIIGHVTVSIDASVAAPLDTSGLIPDDGIILPPMSLPIEEGDTAYDITVEAARLAEIHIDTASGSSYVRGIAHIYEFDFGELSGWTYIINGSTPSVGCGDYPLCDGDELVWYYVLEPTRITN